MERVALAALGHQPGDEGLARIGVDGLAAEHGVVDAWDRAGTLAHQLTTLCLLVLVGLGERGGHCAQVGSVRILALELLVALGWYVTVLTLDDAGGAAAAAAAG